MVKRIKSIALSLMATIFAILAISSPVFATPNDSNTIVTPNDEEVVVTDEPIETIVTEDEEVITEDPTEKQLSCSDQVGSLAWIICPGVGLFGNIIDGAYSLLTSIIEVNPLPTDYNSPIHLVWEYFRDITNIVFVVFFLVVILSQISGFGINNYGIKKVLPRIIITAILVNLSYLICTLAVDVSNILGHSFQEFFRNIQNIAITNGTISNNAQDFSVSGVITAMLGIGTAAGIGFAALATYGSFSGVFWLLLPVLLSGLVAVFSAVITMAARQALIFLLVMVSPLAIIAYMLPNTEKWYKKWYSTLAQMLFFYPMFSILYGASQLASMVIVTSATSWLGVILGIAVKLLPLFMSIPLMRMSNSALGKISGIVGRLAAHPQGAIGRYAMSQQALARQKQLNNVNSRIPHNRLARYLDQQRARRAFDTKELAANNEDRNLTYSMSSWKNRNGKINSRGLRHYENERRKMDYAATRLNVENDFNEGFKDDGTDKRIRAKDLARVSNVNRDYRDTVVKSHTAESRKNLVALNNMEERAQIIHDHVQNSGEAIHQQVLDTFNIDASTFDNISNKKENYEKALLKQSAITKLNAGQALTKEEQDIINTTGRILTRSEQAALNGGGLTAEERNIYVTGQKAINATLADAVAAKREVDKKARNTYLELYNDYEAGPRIKEELIKAFQNKDYNSMSAALEIMYKRGDKDDIGEVLQKYSKEAGGDENIRFQKELNDVCLTMKGEDLDVAQWAKANMMRRGMNGKGKAVESFIDFETWAKGELLAGDQDISAARKTSRVELAEALSNWDPIATADRTMWVQMLDQLKSGIIPKDANGNENLALYPLKYLRSAVCSGKMDGERLDSFNKWFVGGYNSNKPLTDPDNAFFNAHKSSYETNILKFIGEMTAPQLATLKTATLTKLNDAMLAIDPNNTITINGKQISQKLYDAVNTQRDQLNNEHSMAGMRTGMNPAVREMLGIND